MSKSTKREVLLDRFVPEPITGRRYRILVHALADFVVEQAPR
jgi:hypothetical protein